MYAYTIQNWTIQFDGNIKFSEKLKITIILYKHYIFSNHKWNEKILLYKIYLFQSNIGLKIRLLMQSKIGLFNLTGTLFPEKLNITIILYKHYIFSNHKWNDKILLYKTYIGFNPTFDWKFVCLCNPKLDYSIFNLTGTLSSQKNWI